jgi:hypothetical protein
VSLADLLSDVERVAAKKIGELFGTGWTEKEKGKLISFPNLSQTQEWPAESSRKPFRIYEFGCGGWI